MLILPSSTGPRKSGTFAKLLTRVDAQAICGFGFEGVFSKPGARFDESRLWKDGFARDVVMFECAGTPPGSGSGSRREPCLYVLWLYELATGRWREIARAESLSWHWALELRPIAIRLLVESGYVEQTGPPPPDLTRLEARIGRYLDEQLRALKAAERVAVLGAIHDALATRIADGAIAA